MLTDEQEASLVSGGDCNLHSHIFDRSATHEQVQQLQDSESVKVLTANYTASYGDDVLLVDTTAGAVSIVLPTARGGKRYSITRVAGVADVTLLAASLINGAASKAIVASYSAVNIKAVKNMGWVQL